MFHNGWEAHVNNTRKGRTVTRYDKYRNGLVIFAMALCMATCAQAVHGLMYGTFL